MTAKPKQRYTRLTAPRVARIKAELARGKSQREVARREGISGTAVHSIANERTWAWVEPEQR
jgi:DNA invertase Pin-like site-specific DNA recombinase